MLFATFSINDTQHSETQHKRHTQHKSITLNVVVLNIIVLIVMAPKSENYITVSFIMQSETDATQNVIIPNAVAPSGLSIILDKCHVLQILRNFPNLV